MLTVINKSSFTRFIEEYPFAIHYQIVTKKDNLPFAVAINIFGLTLLEWLRQQDQLFQPLVSF